MSKQIPVGKNKFNSREVYLKFKTVMECAPDYEIAKLLGLSNQAFSNQKLRGLAAKTIFDFSFATGVSIDWLVGK